MCVADVVVGGRGADVVVGGGGADVVVGGGGADVVVGGVGADVAGRSAVSEEPVRREAAYNNL